ncbi:MAG: stage 0 sporulation family protein [Lachnospiraceae bacterium]|nr:stage 0 sporulation family protein [Lachnospiraceae bacterium]
MTKVVGIRFRNAGRSYYFDPAGEEYFVGEKVIVETVYGVEIGTVSIPVIEVSDEKVKQPLKGIQRRATEEDLTRLSENIDKEKEAFKICREKIAKHELEMKLVQTEYSFDRNKLLFYFTADNRVDFRELVKDLASTFHTRIELRQIGVRDETKILGGVGICGRELCCRSYLSDFAPVSIKMAKEQSLSLNPTKISGVCGRLMCCLKNEEDTYEYLNKQLPRKNERVTTMTGDEGQVIDTNVLKQTVKVLFEENDEKEIREYHVDELGFRGQGPKASEDGYEGPVVTNEEEDAAEFFFNQESMPEKKAEEEPVEKKPEGRDKHKDRRTDFRRNRKDRQNNEGEDQQPEEKGGKDKNKNRYNRNKNRNRGKDNKDKKWDRGDAAHEEKPADSSKKQRPYYSKHRRTQKKG